MEDTITRKANPRKPSREFLLAKKLELLNLKMELDEKLDASLNSLHHNPAIFKEVNFLLHKIDDYEQLKQI